MSLAREAHFLEQSSIIEKEANIITGKQGVGRGTLDQNVCVHAPLV